jgi:hypothetical protein
MRKAATLIGLMVCLGGSACAGGGRELDEGDDGSEAPDAGPGDTPNILAITSWNADLGVGRCAYEATTLRGCTFVTPDCDPSPLPRTGAGDITMTDGSAQWVLELQGGLYASSEAPPAWAQAELTISAPGADIPAFSVLRKAPVVLTVSQPAGGTHPVDQPLEVRWTGGAADFQILEFGTHDGAGGGQNVKRCLLDGSDRAYTLTPDDLAFLGGPDEDVQICVDGIVTDSITAGDWLIEASSRASGVCTTIDLVAP